MAAIRTICESRGTGLPEFAAMNEHNRGSALSCLLAIAAFVGIAGSPLADTTPAAKELPSDIPPQFDPKKSLTPPPAEPEKTQQKPQ